MSGRKNYLRHTRTMARKSGKTFARQVYAAIAQLEQQHHADALEQAANDMPIETLHGADGASQWLRERARQLRAEADTSSLGEELVQTLTRGPWTPGKDH